MSNFEFFDAKKIMRLVLRVGSSVLLNLAFNTSSKPHVQKVSSCKHPCHTWDLGHETQFKCFQWLRLYRLTSSDLGFKTEDPMWTDPYNIIVLSAFEEILHLHVSLRATSHRRLRAHDHCTSSTLTGGKGGASPSLLHTMLEGALEYVNARWM